MVNSLLRRMHRLVALSASLSLLLGRGISPAGADSIEETWPYKVLPQAKHWPDQAPSNGADEGASSSPASEPQRPCRVRKMSGDEGEKFYMEYWQLGYGSEQQQAIMEPSIEGTSHDPLESRDTLMNLRPRSIAEDDEPLSANGSTSMLYRPAFLVHTDDQVPFNSHFKRGLSMLFPRSGGPRSALQKRDFRCPTGTESCAGIGRPNSCCAQGETCQLIPDTGLGDVGCCSAGQGCNGQVRNCDVGFTGCSGEIGGGCCIPRYVCVSEGCAPGPLLTSVVVVTPTVTRTLSAQAVPSSRTLASSSIDFSSSSPESTPPSTVVSTVTTTASTTIEYTGPQTTLPCSSGFRACPVSLGGGCCRTDRECGAIDCSATADESSTSTSLPPPTSTTTTTTTSELSPSTSASSSPEQTLIAPVRPTSGSGSPSTVTGTDTVTEVTCPTGFYQCAAVYRGGCCRIGRNCDSTSCPPTALTTLQTSNGVTVVVPVSGAPGTDADESKIEAAGTTVPTDSVTSGTTTGTIATTTNGGGGGSCASGWYSCAAVASGGCCPSGYACGISDCQVTATGVPGLSAGGNVGKIPPISTAASLRSDSWLFAMISVVAGGVLLVSICL